MLGGMCTLIGTSTNLILNGLLAEAVGDDQSFFIFDTLLVGGAAKEFGRIVIHGNGINPDEIDDGGAEVRPHEPRILESKRRGVPIPTRGLFLCPDRRRPI